MGFFSRVSNIFRGNVNAALEGLEDPVKTLDVVLADMRKEVGKVRTRITEALTEQKLVEKKIETARAEVEKWLKRAEQAVESGDDALASEALEQKNKSQGDVARLEPTYESIDRETTALKEELKLLEDQLGETERKKDSLVAQAMAAKAKEATAGTLNRAVSNESLEAFERAENQITRLEAKADAAREMRSETRANDPEAKFAALDKEAAKDAAKRELEELKQKMGK